MITGISIEDVRFLFKAAKELGGQPEWLVPNWFFAIKTSQGERYINGAFSPLNPRLNTTLAQNKFLTRLILGRHDLPNIPYIVPSGLEQAEAFLAEHHKIIAKPLTGSDCQDVHIVESYQQLPGLATGGYILEKFINGLEMRYLVVGGKVSGVHRREDHDSVAADRQEKRISIPQSEWDPNLIDISQKTTEYMGLGSAAVDFLIEDPANVPYILEVNSAPGIKAFHEPAAGPPVDFAGVFIRAVLDVKPRW